jgi:hypothetical protein
MGMGDHLHAPTAVLPGKWAVHPVHKAGWATRLVKTGKRNKKSLAPHWSSNPTVQPAASRYTSYTLLLACHREGACMSNAHSRRGNHENYT